MARAWKARLAQAIEGSNPSSSVERMVPTESRRHSFHWLDLNPGKGSIRRRRRNLTTLSVPAASAK